MLFKQIGPTCAGGGGGRACKSCCCFTTIRRRRRRPRQPRNTNSLAISSQGEAASNIRRLKKEGGKKFLRVAAARCNWMMCGCSARLGKSRAGRVGEEEDEEGHFDPCRGCRDHISSTRRWGRLLHPSRLLCYLRNSTLLSSPSKAV